MALERESLNTFERPGLEPSFLHLELHMNRLGRLDYNDVFGGI